jgi:hypothetical protein
MCVDVRQSGCFWRETMPWMWDVRGLTFELTGRQRQGAKPGLAKMYRVPPDRAWWPAVGAPVERGVRPHWNCRWLGEERPSNPFDGRRESPSPHNTDMTST